MDGIEFLPTSNRIDFAINIVSDFRDKISSRASYLVDKLRDTPAKLKQTFWWTITTDKVRPFVWVYYIWLLAWGIYGTFFSAPITFVEPAMGQNIYTLWIWLHLIGPLFAMVGLRMEKQSKEGKLAYFGLNFQAGGHGCMFVVLLAYELAAIDQSYFGRGTYSIFVIGPYVMGCFLLFVQTSVKLWATEAIQRAMKKGEISSERNYYNTGH